MLGRCRHMGYAGCIVHGHMAHASVPLHHELYFTGNCSTTLVIVRLRDPRVPAQHPSATLAGICGKMAARPGPAHVARGMLCCPSK